MLAVGKIDEIELKDKSRRSCFVGDNIEWKGKNEQKEQHVDKFRG